MKKQILIAAGAFLVIVLVLGGIKFAQISAAIAEGKLHGPPPAAVTTMVAERLEWRSTRSAVATVSAVQGATLSTEEMGRITEINFDSGATIEKGQLLLALNTGVEEAALKGAQARLELAEINSRRQKSLRERNANSPSDLDNAQASLREALAEVENLKAQIARKKIFAPFSGRAGIRLVNIGQTVASGTPVVSLHAFDSLYVDFALPQSEIAKLSVGMKVAISAQGLTDKNLVATLSAIESEIDQATRMIKLRATIDNSQTLLRPGMFVEATLDYGTSESYVTIPASSISFAPYGNTIFVVQKSDNQAPEQLPVVQPQLVTTGAQRGDQIAITSGLEVGTEIVTSGAFKLRPGASVIINNSVSPGNDPAPRPANT